jgi:hypothetical protein
LKAKNKNSEHTCFEVFHKRKLFTDFYMPVLVGIRGFSPVLWATITQRPNEKISTPFFGMCVGFSRSRTK